MSAIPESVYTAPAPSSSTPVTHRRRRRQSGERPERYVATLAMTMLGTAVLAIWIGGHAELTVTGYRLTRLKSELSSAQQTNRVLGARAALLADPGRILAEAGKLPMTRAVPAETFFIPSSEPAVTIHHPAVARIAMAPRLDD